MKKKNRQKIIKLIKSQFPKAKSIEAMPSGYNGYPFSFIKKKRKFCIKVINPKRIEHEFRTLTTN